MATRYLDRSHAGLRNWLGSTADLNTTVTAATDLAVLATSDLACVAGDVLIRANALAGYTGTETNAIGDSIVEFLYTLLRRVEDTYNGAPGKLGTDAATVVDGGKPTLFSISRVETTDKAIFTVAIPLTKTTTVEGGSLT